MSNPIKYSTGSESLSLKKGNFYIGTGDVGKGPSDTTGYYQGPNVPSGGYIIYMNKDGAPGNLSYHSAANDSELIAFTNNLAGQSYTTVNECLAYYAGQTDKVCLNRDYEGIVTDGLIFNLDAGFTPSYPKNGTTWYDLGGTSNGVLTNGPTFNSGSGGYISLDGTNDQVNVSTSTPQSLQGNVAFSVDGWFKRNGNMSQGSTWGIGGLASAKGIVGWNAGQANKISIDLWGTSTYTTGQDYSLTDFKHIVWVYKGSSFTRSNIIIYINGVAYTDTDLTIVRGGSGTPDINNTGVVIGKSNISENGQYTPVDVANFKIYDRILTSSEVIQNYNAQKGRFGL